MKEYKSHNTGKVLIALSPVGYPRFASDVSPGSISDGEITAERGILSLARRNRRWLADKGWQTDGDKFGLIIQTPDLLEGKSKFSESDDNTDAMHFYTCLPDCETFQALFNFAKPKDGYQLNYNNNKQTNAARGPSVNKKVDQESYHPKMNCF